MVASLCPFLAENLRADDFTVITAGSGGEAIDVLGASRPDVVLLDVVLPDMSGYAVCRRVRGGDAVNDPWDPDLPIIMLSATGGAHGPQRRVRVGSEPPVEA
jgi:DNA-binding response OmpR family regulator